MSALPPLAPPPHSAPSKPNNNLILAIFSTLCCCLPTGIAAIVYAAQVDSKFAVGDYRGASEAAEKAQLWSWVSIGLGLVSSLIYFALVATGHVERQY